MQGGEALRVIREGLGLTLRDVEAASARLAERHSNQEYGLPISRISDIEKKCVLPSLYRLYSFAVIYRRDLDELMAMFGIDSQTLAADRALVSVPRAHRVERPKMQEEIRVPVSIDPGFDLRCTSNLSRMIAAWGTIPFAMLQPFESDNFTYGYISEDFTMYPLLMPGSFIRVDESKRRIMEGFWRSEYERPIYLMETREGYVCSWCEMDGGRITMRPHPLSPVKSRTFRHDSEVDLVGQVVGVAMRLDHFTPATSPGKGLPSTGDSSRTDHGIGRG